MPFFLDRLIFQDILIGEANLLFYNDINIQILRWKEQAPFFLPIPTTFNGNPTWDTY